MLREERYKDHPVGGLSSIRRHIANFADMLMNKKTRQPTLYGWIFIIMLVLILVKVFYHGNVPPSSAESRPGAGRFISALDKAEDGFPAIHDPQEAEFKAAMKQNLQGGKALVMPDFDPNKHKDMHEHDPVKARHMKRFGRPAPKDFPVGLLQQPRLHCPDNKILLIILVNSSPDGTGERSAIRRTWGVYDENLFPSIDGVQWRTIFVMGMTETRFDQVAAKENEQYGDILQGQFKDTPFEQTRKFMLGMKWLNEHMESCVAQFILKTDNNIYHNMPAIIEWLQTRFKDKKNLYVGKLLRRDRPIRKDQDPYFVSYGDYQEEIFPDLIQSPVYLFSADVYGLLNNARGSVRAIAMEDGYIGMLAKKAGIQPRHNDHFQMLVRPSNVCHHLKMFFMFNVLPYEHIEIFRSIKTALQNKNCLDADMIDFKHGQVHQKIKV